MELNKKKKNFSIDNRYVITYNIQVSLHRKKRKNRRVLRWLMKIPRYSYALNLPIQVAVLNYS